MPVKTSQKPPSSIRYQRVENILMAEPAFKNRLGSKTVSVMKPTGEQLKFCEEVVNVVEAIHSTGKDPYRVHRTEVVKAAVSVLGVGSGNTNGQPEPAASPLVMPKPVRRRRRRKTPAEPDKETPEPSPPQDRLFVAEVGIYSLLVSVHLMVDKHDHQAGREDRLETIDKLAEYYRKLAQG